MKNTLYIFVLSLVMIFSACNNSDDLLTTGVEEGAILNVSGSIGSIAGSPILGKSFEEAEINFRKAEMTYKVGFVGNSGESVDKLIVTKTYKGQTVEVAEVGSGVEEFSKSYSSIADFVEGFESISANNIRIGDVMVFATSIIMNDGRALAYPKADLTVEVSCGADLSGTYSVTNSACTNLGFPFEVEISENADGTWHLTSADGYFHAGCTAGPTLLNAGNISEECGRILFSGDLDFGSEHGPYDIGDITGGTWDAETSILTLQHIQTFSENWPAEWTSTYVRQ